MSEGVIEKLADIILDNCDDKEEIEALIDNVLVLIAELIDDSEWQPSVKDIKQILKDNKDDEELEDEVEDEDDYSIKDEGDGFISLK